LGSPTRRSKWDMGTCLTERGRTSWIREISPFGRLWQVRSVVQILTEPVISRELAEADAHMAPALRNEAAERLGEVADGHFLDISTTPRRATGTGPLQTPECQGVLLRAVGIEPTTHGLETPGGCGWTEFWRYRVQGVRGITWGRHSSVIVVFCRQTKSRMPHERSSHRGSLLPWRTTSRSILSIDA